MTHYIDCPKGCGGEKVLEPNRENYADLRRRGYTEEQAWRSAKWDPVGDGFFIDEKASCDCVLTAEETEALIQKAIQLEMEPREP